MSANTEITPATGGVPAPATDQTPILEIENLHISFYTRAGEIPAVMDYSCKVMPGEALGIVGESGCGKSTVALGIMRDMGNRGHIKSGTIRFKGRDMGEMSDAELRDLRGSKIAMIYQEPMASLNPALKIGQQLMEVPIVHEGVSKQQAYDRSIEMLEAVRLPDPKRVMSSYPHQISGGQQQRVVIAMALLSNPELLLLDEPTTALDVTVEAGIVELVKDLGKKYGMSMLFISHNLGLILETCDRISVMYSGEAVETGDVADVFDRMRHLRAQGGDDRGHRGRRADSGRAGEPARRGARSRPAQARRAHRPPGLAGGWPNLAGPRPHGAGRPRRRGRRSSSRPTAGRRRSRRNRNR